MSDVLVLCYHAVSDRWPAALSVRPAAFGRQLGLLARAGYVGTTFTRALTEPPAPRTVAVTFDDAYRSVLTLGAPLLRARGWPATVFAPTDHVGSERPMAWTGIDRWAGTEHERELVPLSWSELRGLASEGWEVGSHTRSHPRLTQLADAQLADELSGSREAVEARMDTLCRSLAYPYGDVDARVVAAAAASGYSTAAALPAGWHPPRQLEYPRVGVWHGDALWRFAVKAAPPVRWLRARR